MQEKKCQSCGMPMIAVEHFGTKKDNSQSEDYCCFCFQKGEYTDSFGFDEFLEDSLKFHDEKEKIDGVTLTMYELALKTRVELPTLKRWRSHQLTHQEYYESVNKVLDYINRNLSASIVLSDLADVAGISAFHFHRIFKAIMNESPGDYIQRLRLEKAAFKLQTTKLPLADIAEQTGYQSLAALSKAFKKRFYISPSVYRNKPVDFAIPLSRPIDKIALEPDLRVLTAKELLCLRVTNPFKDADAFIHTWNKLLNLVAADGVPGSDYEYFCLSRDISTITHPENYRIYACISMPEKIKPKGNLGLQTIDGGLYAVFTYKGSYRNLDVIYCNIYRYWIPKSNYELRDNISFEKYLNSPLHTSEEELLTEIYVPVNRI